MIYRFLGRPAGSPSYAGYEYQIRVTVWVALDLMFAKERTDALTIEPPSREDIEAALTAPEQASLAIVCEAGAQLSMQVKTRSRGPWTGPALANVLKGRGRTTHSRTRASPLAMLAADARRRYVFITNEGLSEGLRPHAGEHLLDCPGAEILPPHTRSGVDAASQRSISSRLLLLGGVTTEVLQGRICRLIARFGHVGSERHTACISDLEAAVRERLGGYAGGRWARAEVLEVLIRHGGSVLPTRTMDHYVAPTSYAAIRRCLDEHHIVVIAGGAGTGKTLTADIIEHGLRCADPPYQVIGEAYGPGYVRAQLMIRKQPVVFHLRDPWGANRLKPGADRWSSELPKLLRDAGPGRKFVITSRSDVLQSAGDALQSEIARYVVSIDVEHYGPDRLGQIYDRASTDLSGRALHLSRAYRERALETLSRPYEIDRFLVALAQAGTAAQDVERLLKESQVDAISRTVAQQITGLERDGMAGATVIWAMLNARGAVAADVFPMLRRQLRLLDPTLTVDVDGLVDFLVAGRNLRREQHALAFHHPRVEDGLRSAILSRRAETEHVLSKVGDVLAAWDAPGEDWGVETLRNMVRVVADLEGIQLCLSERTHARLDSFLEAAVLGKDETLDVVRAFEDLQQYGSEGCVASQLARLLMDGEDDTRYGTTHWRNPSLSVAELTRLKQHPGTQRLLDRFVRDVLPFSPIHYDRTFVAFVTQFGFDLKATFTAALEEVVSGIRYAGNIDVVVVGILNGDSPDFDALIEIIAQHTSMLDAWLAGGYEASARMAVEHELNATMAEDVLNAPAYRYCGVKAAMSAVVQLRRESQGLAWIQGHPHQQLVVASLCDLFASRDAVLSQKELLCLLEYADGSNQEGAWCAARQHWHPDLNALLELELLKPDLHSPDLLRQLLDNAVVGSQAEEKDGVPTMLARVAARSAVERRLELVYHLMSVREYKKESLEDETAAHLRAVRLAETLPAPQDELARALCAVLGGNDIGALGRSLSAPAVQLLSATLRKLPVSVAGTAACLAAAAGIDPLVTAERLLATDSAEDGEAAVRALLLYGTSEAIAAVRRASTHGRYPVRCLVLRALVERAAMEDTDRVALSSAAYDRSAEVRRTWAELMRAYLWPEAVDSLVRLLKDQHDFCAHHVFPGPDSWTQYCVARFAARALGSYANLPGSAIDALLAAATDTTSEDPYVACSALASLACNDDPRVPAALHAALFSPVLHNGAVCSPVAEAASWSILDRVLNGKRMFSDTSLFELACRSPPEVCCPLLMAYGALAGNEREVLLSRLPALGLQDHAELVLLATAMTGRVPESNSSKLYSLMAKRAAGETLDAVQEAELEAWSRSLDPANTVQRYAVWIAARFNLPVQEHSRLPCSHEERYLNVGYG